MLESHDFGALSSYFGDDDRIAAEYPVITIFPVSTSIGFNTNQLFNMLSAKDRQFHKAFVAGAQTDAVRSTRRIELVHRFVGHSRWSMTVSGDTVQITVRENVPKFVKHPKNRPFYLPDIREINKIINGETCLQFVCRRLAT